MMLAAVMALKAYSIPMCQPCNHGPVNVNVNVNVISDPRSVVLSKAAGGVSHTNLIQPAIVGKDGNVSVVSSGCRVSG